MLSNSFIVSASPVPSPVLTGFARKRRYSVWHSVSYKWIFENHFYFIFHSDGAFPTYANLRNNDANRINEFPEDNDTYNSSRRIKRSLSVSKSSDFVKQRQNIKSRYGIIWQGVPKRTLRRCMIFNPKNATNESINDQNTIFKVNKSHISIRWVLFVTLINLKLNICLINYHNLHIIDHQAKLGVINGKKNWTLH